jgi:DNA sulfur modification protein DndE
MLPKRLHISQGATDKLRILKGRTGLTPNIICRIALVLSLNDGAKGGKRKTDMSGSEFNIATLFGEQAGVFEALLKQVHGLLDHKLVGQIIASHIDDGLQRLTKAKSLIDLVQHSR